MNTIKLFASCIPVKGAIRSTICDLQRNNYDLIPNSMFEFIQYYEGKSIDSIKNDFTEDEHEIIDEYIEFLLTREYIFLTDIPDSFPPLNLEWASPNLITNSIVDFDSSSDHDFGKIMAELTYLRCQGLELRFFDVTPMARIRSMLLQTNHSSLRSTSLLIRYEEEMNEQNLLELFELESTLTSVLIHDCPAPVFDASDIGIFYTADLISDETHCGVIDKFNFTVNITAFTEAVNFNSCLNRKISIDRKGNIRNCPSSAESFGKIPGNTLLEALNSKSFKKLWTIKKDDVLICKDCEFRYICTDCRVYVHDQDNIYSKPLKCNYDPYTAEYTIPQYSN